MAMLPGDRELLARFREGDPSALDIVYRYYAPQVARFLQNGFVYTGTTTTTLVRLTAPFELENAVQEVFLRAFEPRTRVAYDGLRPYLDFLKGIGRHVVLDELRRRAAREQPVADDILDRIRPLEEQEPDLPPDERLAEEEARAVVAQFLERECNDRDRQLYALRFVEDLPQEATGCAAGLTRIQVRKWETKFRARLLRHLKRVGYAR